MRLLFLLALLIPQIVFSQIKKDSIHFSGYTEIYFAQDQHNWNDHQRPDFLYSHTSTNHVALNTAVLDFKYSSARVKTQLSLVEGTYANKVTSSEPIGFGALYVGNISYKLYHNITTSLMPLIQILHPTFHIIKISNSTRSCKIESTYNTTNKRCHHEKFESHFLLYTYINLHHSLFINLDFRLLTHKNKNWRLKG